GFEAIRDVGDRRLGEVERGRKLGRRRVAALADLLQDQQLRRREAGRRGKLPIAHFGRTQDSPQGPERGDGQILVHRSWLASTSPMAKKAIIIPPSKHIYG